MKVRFTQSVTTREAVPQSFEAGKEYELLPASARRWIRRNVAVEVLEVGGSAGNTDAPRSGAKKRAKKKAARSSLSQAGHL